MAATLVAHTAAGSTNSGVSATTSAINTTTASLIVVAVASYQNTPVDTFTDSAGNTWTAQTAHAITADTQIQLFYCEAPTTSASHTFDAFRTGFIPCYPALAVGAFAGTTGAPDIATGATATASKPVTVGPTTPAFNNELIISGFAFSIAALATVDSSLSITDQINFSSGNNYGVALAWIGQTAAASVGPTWSASVTGNLAGALTSFQTSGGAVSNSAMMAFLIGG